MARAAVSRANARREQGFGLKPDAVEHTPKRSCGRIGGHKTLRFQSPGVCIWNPLSTGGPMAARSCPWPRPIARRPSEACTAVHRRALFTRPASSTLQGLDLDHTTPHSHLASFSHQIHLPRLVDLLLVLSLVCCPTDYLALPCPMQALRSSPLSTVTMHIALSWMVVVLQAV